MKKIVRFFVGVKKEMEKVRFPKRKEMVVYSSATISFILLFMVYFVGVDALLGMIVKVFS